MSGRNIGKMGLRRFVALLEAEREEMQWMMMMMVVVVMMTWRRVRLRSSFRLVFLCLQQPRIQNQKSKKVGRKQ